VREERVTFAGRLVRVTDVICRAPRGGCGREEHSEKPEIVVPRRGVFTLHRGRRQIVVDPKTAVVLRGEYRVAHPSDGGDRCIALTVSPELLEEVLGDAFILRAPRRLAIANGFDELEGEEQALSFLAELAGETALRASPRVEQVRELLAAHPAERWTLADIARTVSTSPYHLARQFRTTTGQTIGRYLTELRLTAALDRLHGGDENLARLAADLGFASHSHLAERFRRVYGTTPSQVRKILTAGRVGAG
jgi:AraC-like DNA-binding protein